MTSRSQASAPAERHIFCNRTLNLRAIQAIGYDMDYTLIHYHEVEWERRAFAHLRDRLRARGWPMQGLEFVPDMMARGLVLDIERGNTLKVNRFGYVKHAYHGTRPIEFKTQREAYSRTIVDLSLPRFVFLNTLFALSEGCMYAQLVELLDQQQIPEVLGYSGLYQVVRHSLDAAHMEGQLKGEILADPDRFVAKDDETALALLDQKHAGKRLLLITNSEWAYTRDMMAYAFDSALPGAMTWRDLFDLVVVSAQKPDFFSSRAPLFEVVSEDGLLKPVVGGLRYGGIYLGGNAGLIEEHTGLSGDEILYVGDHIWGDVHVSKKLLRWRTALVLRELEQEIAENQRFRADQARLHGLMAHKERLEYEQCQLKLEQQRAERGYGPPPPLAARTPELRAAALAACRDQLSALDEQIKPIAQAAATLGNRHFGLLMRAGNDKSMLTRQVERSADIYMSRVSNFYYQSPFAYLRSPRGSLPHDPLDR